MTHDHCTVQLHINGIAHNLQVSPTRRLLDILRDDMGLTGPKEGCGIGRCGACSVLVNGESVPACLLLAYQLQGKHVETIEGLRTQPVFEHVSHALVEAGALQCGYCTPGIAGTLTGALLQHPDASAAELEQALYGNLCRCTGYGGLKQAIAALTKHTDGPGMAPATVHSDDA